MAALTAAIEEFQKQFGGKNPEPASRRVNVGAEIVSPGLAGI